jgi:hypothetical protein
MCLAHRPRRQRRCTKSHLDKNMLGAEGVRYSRLDTMVAPQLQHLQIVVRHGEVD